MGLLLILGAGVIATGTATDLGLRVPDLLPLIGYGGIAAMALLGLLLCAAGIVRRTIRRDEHRRHALRSARLATVALLSIGALSVVVPLASDLLNVLRLDGFPFGYYLAAQGVPIALAIVAFVWAGRQNRIDARGPDA